MHNCIGPVYQGKTFTTGTKVNQFFYPQQYSGGSTNLVINN